MSPLFVGKRRKAHETSKRSFDGARAFAEVGQATLLAAHLDAALHASLISLADHGRALRGPAPSDFHFAALGATPQAQLELAPDRRAFLARRRRRYGFPE